MWMGIRNFEDELCKNHYDVFEHLYNNNYFIPSKSHSRLRNIFKRLEAMGVDNAKHAFYAAKYDDNYRPVYDVIDEYKELVLLSIL